MWTPSFMAMPNGYMEHSSCHRVRHNERRVHERVTCVCVTDDLRRRCCRLPSSVGAFTHHLPSPGPDIPSEYKSHPQSGPQLRMLSLFSHVLPKHFCK